MCCCQECTIQKIRSHYQLKLNTLRRILDLYQEKVEKKNADWKKTVVVSVHQFVCLFLECLFIGKNDEIIIMQ